MGTGAQTAWLDVSTDLVRTGWGHLGSVGRGLGEVQTPTQPGARWVGARAGVQREPMEQELTRRGSTEGKGPGNPGRVLGTRAGRDGGSTGGGKGSPQRDRWDGSARGWGLRQREEAGSGVGSGRLRRVARARGLGAAGEPIPAQLCPPARVTASGRRPQRPPHRREEAGRWLCPPPPP